MAQKTDVIPATLHLIEINLARGRPVTAGVYINWILDHTEVDDPRRMLALHRITAGLEVCE